MEIDQNLHLELWSSKWVHCRVAIFIPNVSGKHMLQRLEFGSWSSSAKGMIAAARFVSAAKRILTANLKKTHVPILATNWLTSMTHAPRLIIEAAFDLSGFEDYSTVQQKTAG